MPKKTINIAITDDDFVMRTLLISTLKKISNIKISCIATNGEDLLSQLKRIQIDILLLDLYMPIMDGWEVLEHLQKKSFSGKIICMSNGYSQKSLNKLMNLGALCYVKKDSILISKCIQHIHDNKQLSFLQDQVEVILSESPSLNYTFNDTELRIIQYLAEGFSYNEIVEKPELMHLSPRSIETYVLKMIKILELRNRLHLVSYAYANGILHTIDGQI